MPIDDAPATVSPRQGRTSHTVWLFQQSIRCRQPNQVGVGHYAEEI